MVVDGEACQIPQALAAPADSQHLHQYQVASWDTNVPPYERVRDRPEVADQIEIGSGRSALEYSEEAIPTISTRSRSPGKRCWNRVGLISAGDGMSHLVKAGQHLDVDVNQVARRLGF